MKNLLLILFCIFLSSSLAFATENSNIEIQNLINKQKYNKAIKLINKEIPVVLDEKEKSYLTATLKQINHLQYKKSILNQIETSYDKYTFITSYSPLSFFNLPIEPYIQREKTGKIVYSLIFRIQYDRYEWVFVDEVAVYANGGVKNFKTTPLARHVLSCTPSGDCTYVEKLDVELSQNDFMSFMNFASQNNVSMRAYGDGGSVDISIKNYNKKALLNFYNFVNLLNAGEI